MTLTAAYGLLAHGLICGAIAALLPLGDLRARAALAATALAMLVGIAPLLHGLFGPPSLTLLQLAVLLLANRTPTTFGYRPALGLLIVTLPFYAMALGLLPLDAYALGFQPWPLLAALLPIGLALWWRRQYTWLTVLAIDILGYAAGIFDNLWDALVDPLLAGLAALIVLRWQVLRFIASRRR